MKPIFRYVGGKTKLIKRYQPYMPPTIESYCEPFFGGGAMFVYVIQNYNPKNILINDINASISNIYQAIKTDYRNFISLVDMYEQRYLKLSKADRKKLYYELRHHHAYDYEIMSKSKEAALLYFLMQTCFNGLFDTPRCTNGRFGTASGLLNQKTQIYDRSLIAWWNQALQRATITNLDWRAACSDLPDETFFFLDPPYRGCSKIHYGTDFKDSDLLDLIDFADKKPSVMLTNRDDENGWLDKHKKSLKIARFPYTYTVSRNRSVKAVEALLYRTPINVENIMERIAIALEKLSVNSFSVR